MISPDEDGTGTPRIAPQTATADYFPVQAIEYRKACRTLSSVLLSASTKGQAAPRLAPLAAGGQD